MDSIKVDLNIKFVEILSRLVLEQNKQLLQIIADEEGICYNKINNFLPSSYELKKQLMSLQGQRNLCEKSNSTSESSELCSEPDES
jgi:hypothetical protein